VNPHFVVLQEPTGSIVQRCVTGPGTPPAPESASKSRRDFLWFSPPIVGQEEIDEVVDTLRSGWITTGPKTRQFEAAFKSRVDAPAVLAVNSSTAGLHLGLLSVGIRPGDEVISTPMTFCAGANAIEQIGATTRFADVEADTLNLDPRAVEDAVTPRTRAILAVHYAGHPAELDGIRDIAQRYHLAIIEDAAHAVPASYKGRLIGASENPVAFSFCATKNLTTGDGGMLAGSAELVSRARTLARHGMSSDAWKRSGPGRSWIYEVDEPGFKYNMTDIQAAIGLAQLRQLGEFQRRRRQIAALYSSAFREVDALEIPVERPEVEHAWHLYVLRLRLGALRVGRNRFMEELRVRNIGTSVHFIPIHLHPYYRQKYQYRPEQFPVALGNYQRMLSLPIHPRLSDQDVSDVVEAVLDVVTRFAR
jgi:dTDP-4-amino-4,6-dideoxygalactose transaminase